MTKARIIWTAAGLATALVAAPSFAQADAARDLQVAGRTLTFLENGPTGKVTVGVVFDPAKPASVAEKDEVMAALGSGLSVGGLTLVGKPIEVSGISAGVGALIVMHGVNNAALGAAAKTHKLVAIGLDMACVKAGACAVGVASSPKVEIVVNHDAAAAVGAQFKAAFRMMIKEI